MTAITTAAWNEAIRQGFTHASMRALAEAAIAEGSPIRPGVLEYIRRCNYPLRGGEYWWWLAAPPGYEPPPGYEALLTHQVPPDAFEQIKGGRRDERKKGFPTDHQAVAALVLAYTSMAVQQAGPPKVGDAVHWYDDGWGQYRCGHVITPGEKRGKTAVAVGPGDLLTDTGGVAFVEMALLVRGFRSVGELREMTAGRHGEKS